MARTRSIALLESELLAAVDAAAVIGEAERVLGQEYDVCIAETAVLAVDDALQAVVAEGPEQGLLLLTELSRRGRRGSAVRHAQEFDDWMAEPKTSLTLNPNR